MITDTLRLCIAPALLACLSAGVAAQGIGGPGEKGLLYTTNLQQRSTQCMLPSPSAHNTVVIEDVEYIVPPIDGNYAAWCYAPQTGYCEMVGDHDCDGDYWEASLFGAVDALVRPRDRALNPIPLNARRLFVSPRDQVRHGGMGWVFEPGDIGRFLPSGRLETFINESQVRTLLGMWAGPANVDAAALVADPEAHGIFLSFEDDTMCWFGPIRDGDIVFIPWQDVNLGTSGYDGAAIVVAVRPAPNGARVWLRESQLDAMCRSSGVSDSGGAPVQRVIDVDGLTGEPDPRQYGGLWFSGEGLDGCSVLSTAFGGRIAVLNGRRLGQAMPIPTDGTQVGLVPPAKQGLNGLSGVEGDLYHMTTDTTTPSGGGTVVAIEIGGAPTGPIPTWLLIGGALDVCGPADPSFPPGVPSVVTGFPDVYPFIIAPPFSPVIVPIGAEGCGLWRANLPPFPGVHLTAQALSVDTMGQAILSTPTVVDM